MSLPSCTFGESPLVCVGLCAVSYPPVVGKGEEEALKSPETELVGLEPRRPHAQLRALCGALVMLRGAELSCGVQQEM